ncbi:hypothetical protein M758_4G167400 [Ceratodon purpureus]|nr:hypothetical protein M758_4G167400 [Ceratodon purpureus]
MDIFLMVVVLCVGELAAIAQKLNSTTDFQGGNRDTKEEIGKILAQLLREGLKLQKEAKAAQQRSSSLGYLDASKKTVYRNQKSSTSEKGTTVSVMLYIIIIGMVNQPFSFTSGKRLNSL